MRPLTNAKRIGAVICIGWAAGVCIAALLGAFDAHYPIASLVAGHPVTEFDRYSWIRFLCALLAPILVYWIGYLVAVLARRKSN
jgi:hypothetical protein